MTPLGGGAHNLGMATNTTTKTVGELTEGDIVLGTGNVTFTEPHTVTEVRRIGGRSVFILATGGSFWPVDVIGRNTPAVVAA